MCFFLFNPFNQKMDDKLLKFLQALTTFLLGYLFFNGLIEKLIKSIIILSVKLFTTQTSCLPLDDEHSNSNTTVDTIKCELDNYASENAINIKLISIEIASGSFLTLLVLTSLFSIWLLKKSSKLITINSFLLCFYCLITSIYSSIMSTLHLRVGVMTSEKYFLILDGITFVLIQVVCASCLFLASKKVKLLNK